MLRFTLLDQTLYCSALDATLCAGMIVQGAFFALGPKTEWPVLVLSLLGTGAGMGMVDGCAPALLAQLSELRHGGSGIIYTAQTVAIQLGFLVGSVAGSAVMQYFGYSQMGVIVGVFLIVCSPLMLVNRRLPSGTGTRPKRMFRLPKDDPEVPLIEINPEATKSANDGTPTIDL